jgi:hypothetical protein
MVMVVPPIVPARVLGKARAAVASATQAEAAAAAASAFVIFVC